MKLVAGLGNPGPRYARSRHNVGFLVVDVLADRWMADVSRYDKRFEALVGDAQVGSERVLLLKPQTFMNLSGRSVSAALRYYKLAPSDLIVVHDDLDLPVGGLRVRATGSAGGQKGMVDVLRHLGTQDVPRVRIGIGKVHRLATTEHVLGTFTPDEQAVIGDTVSLAADAVSCWLREGVEPAMNKFNRRRDSESPPSDKRSEGE